MKPLGGLFPRSREKGCIMLPMDNCILLVKMFAGGFNVDNLGHEIINYYLDDDEKYYHIFVPPYGEAAQDNIGPILLLEKTNISYILKVVAVIKNHSEDDSDFSLVKYDGQSLDKIQFNEKESEEEDCFFQLSTFKCKKDDYYKTRDLNLFIIPAFKDKGPFDEANRKNLIHQFKKENPKATLVLLGDKKPWHNITYLDKGSEDYSKIDELILSKATDNTQHNVAGDLPKSLGYEQDNILRYIDKEYDENAMTSFFYSLLNEKKELAKTFVSFITGQKDCSENVKIRKQKLALTDNQILINRYLNACKRDCKSKEKYKKQLGGLKADNALSPMELGKIEEPIDQQLPFERGIMDLFIETNQSLIVIENKIKSNLNGKNINEDGEETSQLSKYDQYLSLVSGNKQRYIFVFAPDYNCNFLIDKNLSAAVKTIKYSEIYAFFEKELAAELNDRGVWGNKYNLFLNALKKHSINLEYEMLIRFKNAIKK